jgi:mannose-6-phosphate isomerase
MIGGFFRSIFSTSFRQSSLKACFNSDNVLRGGLTPKHVDIPEMLALVRCEETRPHIIRPVAAGNPLETVYPSPAREFVIAKIDTGRTDVYRNRSRSVEILFLLNGAVILCGSDRIPLGKGSAAVVLAGEEYRIETISPSALLFRAAVPE